MKFAESWLREHVAVDATREDLCAALTAIGLEVEGVDVLGAQLDGVVVAEILSAEKHPEADRLRVCQVDVGGGKTVQIVCGAPNARAGLKAPLATVGAVLPGGVNIKAAKLRGVESFGMLCSAKELAIDPDASGLLELPANASVGAALSAYLGLPDACIELKLTPNRADCFSVRGIAFDVAAALGARVSPLVVPDAEVTSPSAFPVRLEAGSDAPRYCGRVVDGLDPEATTPQWVAERLKRSGLRPISPLVDITNYVMLELGQPMHAFDADALRGPVAVRRGRTGERLMLLDERVVDVDDEVLLITDADRPVALAGVMGGFDTRVTAGTTRVFLESAHFAPAAIIGRARRYGLHTDASHRFERGVDPELPRIALERATALVLEICGGQAGPVTEAVLVDRLPIARTVNLRRRRLAMVLGMEVPDAEVTRILEALGLRVASIEDGWHVIAPPRRFDIAIEEDLIEEIARIHGYERVPVTLPGGRIPVADHTETRVSAAILRRQLAARGFQEAINFAFVDAALLMRWHLNEGSVPLLNPLASDLGTMRTSLLPGLVEALRRNRARQQSRVRLFELGRTFHAPAIPGDAPGEVTRIAAVACGLAESEAWGASRREVDFHHLKGDLEALLAVSAPETLAFHPADLPWLHPGRSALVHRDGQPIGVIGHLHPRLLAALDLDTEVLVFELEAEALARRGISRAGELSRFPSVRRDLAVVVPEAMPWTTLEASVRAALGSLLKDVVVFDRYVGPGLGEGNKSLAMGLILQDVSRTLTDSDADEAMQAALSALQRDCGAQRR